MCFLLEAFLVVLLVAAGSVLSKPCSTIIPALIFFAEHGMHAADVHSSLCHSEVRPPQRLHSQLGHRRLTVPAVVEG